MTSQPTPESAPPLVSAIYDELRKIAGYQMRRQPLGHTLQVTDLVHEAYARLAKGSADQVEDAAHFLASAAVAMRCVLIDHARSKASSKRQAQGKRVPLDDLYDSFQERALDLVALDDALTKLATFDKPMAKAVEIRLFAGLELERIADMLGIPQRTFERHWASTRSWLHKEVQ